MLIKIGDFAKATQVTVKALRHYERLGILKPAWINRFNSYRYYAPEQQTRLNLVLAYKDMGFPLEQIACLLDEKLENAELQTLLENRHSAFAESN